MIFRPHRLIFPLLFLSCAANSPTKIQVSERKSGNIESISMINNGLDFYLENAHKPYRCFFNPGIIKTNADTYYTLNFSSGNQAIPLELSTADSLLLKLDDSEIRLHTLDVSRIGKKYSAYYRIDEWDLIDIGHAENVQVYFIHGDTTFKAILSEQNILNFQYFTAKYILKSTEIPVPDPPVYQQPWGFLSGGIGSLYDFWLAGFTNFIQTNSRLGDFIAAGIGYAPFYYTEWGTADPPPDIEPGSNQSPISSWVEFNQSHSSSLSLNLMYGLTHPSPLGRWSIEAGVCFYYFFTDDRWQDGQVKYLENNILTIIDSGKPYKGISIGGFIQIGGLWFQINSKNWTAGISVPVPWW